MLINRKNSWPGRIVFLALYLLQAFFCPRGMPEYLGHPPSLGYASDIHSFLKRLKV
jgi:hypothetical protein